MSAGDPSEGLEDAERYAGDLHRLGLLALRRRFGAPRLLVRFDDSAMSVFGGAVLAGNGMFYCAVGEVESDIYVMDLVR